MSLLLLCLLGVGWPQYFPESYQNDTWQVFSSSASLPLSVIFMVSVLCIVGCWAPSLASSHCLPIATTPIPRDNPKCLQKLPNAPWQQNVPSWEPQRHLCSRGTAQFSSTHSNTHFLMPQLLLWAWDFQSSQRACQVT
jgi:hypothetical protein